ncbi:MAG: purine-binding chemotaxis protein CheW [Planctomycetota bacterium]|jgi:purine-binding chemotaxis protein CheW
MSTTQASNMTAESTLAANDSVSGRYLTFQLAEQEYGIAILSVREIIAMQDITPVPGVPMYVQGVINLRGRIIPVIDLRLRLCLEAAEQTERNCIIVTEIESEDSGQLQVGCIVDTVSEVMNVDADRIEAPPDLGVDLSTIMGLAKFEDCGKVISLLDIHRVLDTLQSF